MKKRATKKRREYLAAKNTKPLNPFIKDCHKEDSDSEDID